MSTLQGVIDDIRLEMTDEQSTRWTDAQLLRAIGRTVRRVQHILFRNDIEFGRTRYSFNTVAGEDEYALPADFMVDYGLFRPSDNTKLTKHSDESWEQLESPDECTVWIVRGSNLLIGGTPSSVEAMNLIYWPTIDTSAYAVGTTSPWSGKLDDIIVEYTALRLKNIDEMDAAFDTQLLQDLENNILNTYAAIDPIAVQKRGWLV